MNNHLTKYSTRLLIKIVFLLKTMNPGMKICFCSPPHAESSLPNVAVKRFLPQGLVSCQQPAPIPHKIKTRKKERKKMEKLMVSQNRSSDE